MFNHSPSFSLANFEGPLELLLYLIQKDEMDVYDVVLKDLTEQFLHAVETLDAIDIGAETLGMAATLLLLKSHKLLPKEEIPLEEELNRVEMIQQLIEYCRFKETAKELSLREEEQKAFFPRAAPPIQKKLGSGLEEVGIEDLKKLLQDVMSRAKNEPNQTIQGETWHVSEKIDWFRTIKQRLTFDDVFSEKFCRDELIVSFLALLELMKLGELKVVRENQDLYIISI